MQAALQEADNLKNHAYALSYGTNFASDIISRLAAAETALERVGIIISTAYDITILDLSGKAGAHTHIIPFSARQRASCHGYYHL